jgi:hypothetical protein
MQRAFTVQSIANSSVKLFYVAVLCPARSDTIEVFRFATALNVVPCILTALQWSELACSGRQCPPRPWDDEMHSIESEN